jgi:hypothetical protein
MIVIIIIIIIRRITTTTTTTTSTIRIKSIIRIRIITLKIIITIRK